MRRYFWRARSPLSSTDTILWLTAPSPEAATGPRNSRAMSRSARHSARSTAKRRARSQSAPRSRGAQQKTSRQRRQRHAQSVSRLRYRPHLPLRRGARGERHGQILEEVPRETLGLHIGEMQPKAHMRAAAERHPGEAMAAALRLIGETQGIEPVGFGPYLAHVMGK